MIKWFNKHSDRLWYKLAEKSFNDVMETIQDNAKTTLPVYVTYFRSGRYHQWGDLVGYIEYDNTYFSYDYNLKEMYENGNL